MIVALDMQLALGTATGIGEYARGLANALSASGVRVIELQEPKLDPWRFDRRVRWDQIVLPQRARASGADLLHCTSGTMPLRPTLPAVVTVHDVAWFKAQAHARPYARFYFGKFALSRYRRAAAIAVDSEFSRSELLQLLEVHPSRVHVIYPGVGADYCELRRSPDGSSTILVPGTVERRKNLEVLIRALTELPRARIVSVGPFTSYRDECEHLARELGVDDRVEFRGYVARDQLIDLYASCALVAVPSRYEGFGYAAAQALCAGVPVVVSDRASLPEVAGGCAKIADADDPAQWRSALEEIFADATGANARAAGIRDRSAERFSWHASASKMIAAYRGALVHG